MPPTAPPEEAPAVAAVPGRGRFLASFAHAAAGLLDGLEHGRNMKLQVVCGILVALVGGGVPLGVMEKLSLAACVVLVIAAEAFNTAIEAAVDLAVSAVHPLAKVAKDAAAGAVLVLAAGSVLVLALVLDADWPSIARQGEAIRRQVVFGVPLASCAAMLVARWRRPILLDIALALAGCALISLLASWTASVAFSAMGASLFALCVAAAMRRRM